MDETDVPHEDADVEAETILDLDASGVVTTVSNRLEHGGNFVLL